MQGEERGRQCLRPLRRWHLACSIGQHRHVQPYVVWKLLTLLTTYYSLLTTHQVTIAYVMWKLGLGATDALRLVKGARACVRPNPGFVAQLKAWEARLKAGEVMIDR